MAWSVPLTAVDLASLSASEYNSSVRDNLLETEAAIATAAAAGSLFVGDGVNSIAQRRVDSAFVSTSQSTTTTSYTNLATTGPSVTVTTGERALVFTCGMVNNNDGNWSSYISHEVTGASSISASDTWAFRRQGTRHPQGMSSHLHTELTPGSNTFTAKYRVAGSTGTFANRRIVVWPF